MIISLVTALALLADPIQGAPELTNNDLYKQGKLAQVTCKLTKGTGKAATTKYVKALAACMDKAWKHDPVKLTIKYDSTGKSWPFPYFGGLYVGLGDDWVKSKKDVPVIMDMAEAYGELILRDTGIAAAAHKLDYQGDEKLLKEHGNRYYYQKQCMAGVTIRALGRPIKSFKPLLKGNALSWFTQGYKAGGPKACNTWKASESKVS